MPKKKPVSTKRGQHHQHKSFVINLVKDISLTKIDTNVVRKHQDSFEKKKVRFEKRNADPVYFRQTVCQEFPSLSDGVEFSFWRLSKDNPTLIPLPPEINNAASLCNFDELNRSSLYIRLQAAPPSIPLSFSSTQPQLNHQISDLIDSAGQQADESPMSLETTALHVVTGMHDNIDDIKQILNYSTWNVTTMMGPNGELLVKPLNPVSATPAPVSMQPTTTTVEEIIANDDVLLDMSAKEKSSVDLVRARNAHSSCIPKKRKITSEPDQETIAIKHHQSSSVLENNRSNATTDVVGSDYFQHDYMNNLQTTEQGIPMDSNSGGVTGELLTQSTNLILNDGQQDQLFPDKGGYSSSLANFNNHGTRYQQNSYQLSAFIDLSSCVGPTSEFKMPQINTSHSGNSPWISDQINPNGLPHSGANLMNPPYLHNFRDPLSESMPHTHHFPPQQQTLVSHDSLNTQHLVSHMLQMQQPPSQLEMVSQNTSGSGCASRSEKNASDDEPEPEMPNVQMIGQVDNQMLKDKESRGVAVLQDLMYLIYDDVNTVYVHLGYPPYIQLNEIVIEEMEYPCCIVASVEHDCIYIADVAGEQENVWRLLRNAQNSETFLEHIESLESISVTEEGNLLLLISDVEEFSFVRTYDADARCIQNIAMQPEINCAVQLGATKLFVNSVCFGEDSFSSMMEVSLDGVILHLYGPFVRTYFEFGGMTLGEGNQIFVIDKAKGGRILVFGSRARLIGVLLSKDVHQIKEITRLCYVKDKRQLVVSGSHEIVIYQLVQNQGPEMDGNERNREKDLENPVFYCRQDSNLPHAEQIGKIQHGRGYDVKDITVMKGKVYIVYEGKNTLSVYSSSTFQRESGIRVNGMNYPRCISACAEKNCLFISDGESDSSVCIWCVEDGDEVVSEKFVEDVECRSLSVTRNGELLIVDGKHKCIHLYGSDGRCLRCVKLTDEYEFGKPQFAVNSLRDSFYVSSCTLTKSEEMETHWCMIFEMSKDGDLLKTFGGRAGRGSGQPSGSANPLALDKYGRVIVGDQGNHRILLLDSNLQLLTILLNRDELKDVFTSSLVTHFYVDSNLIFVENRWPKEKEVAVFSLSQRDKTLNSSHVVFSRAMPDTDEFHLVCSIGKYLDDKIRGVATLMDSIYVLDEIHVSIYTFTNPHKGVREYWHDSDLWDIAANVSDRCLYVTDKKEQCVWSIGIDFRRKKWLEGIGSPYTLSVAKDGSVLILNNKNQSLDIYNKDGQQLQRIRLSLYRILFLRHAVKMSYSRGNETYLFCHGHNIYQDATADDDYESDCFSHEVVMISSNGDRICVFGGKFGSNVDQLHLPSHLVLDRDNTLLVADYKNNRVLRLDHQLKLQNIPFQSMEEPFRLRFDENTAQIIVANSNSVDIFVHCDTIQRQSQDQSFSSDLVANTDEPEPEMPNVRMIGQVDNQMLKDKAGIGAAVLQDLMYLIYDGVNTVYVHSSDPPYTQLNETVIEEMENPCCIVASVEHDCIYIEDYDGEQSKIWRLLRNDQNSEKFLEDIKSLESISVTEEGHLLLLIGHDEIFSLVGTYDADARCIQSIAIQHDINCAVKLGATKLFVNSVYFDKDYCDAVMEMSLHGVMLHSYGPFVRTHFECGGMTVGEGNQIFVIDEAKGDRILVFGSSARLIGVLLSKDDHQIKEITGLCYVKDKNQLVVSGSDQIVIYQLSQAQNQGSEMDGYGRKRAIGVENPVLCSRQENSGQHLFTREVSHYSDGPVRAVAKLKDKLYLLSCVSLLVCSSQDLITKPHIFSNTEVRIPEDRSRSNPRDDGLWDIAASEIDLCLYVTDRNYHSVWRVTIDHKITKWLTDIGSPYTLSVTEDGCLCILSNVYKHLDIYDRSGTRKKSIRLPPYMEYLLHALQTSTGTYVVSWTWKRQEVLKDDIRRNGDRDAKRTLNTKKNQEHQNNGKIDNGDDDNGGGGGVAADDDDDHEVDDDDDDDGDHGDHGASAAAAVDDDGGGGGGDDDDRGDKNVERLWSDWGDVVFDERHNNCIYGRVTRYWKLKTGTLQSRNKFVMLSIISII